MTTPDGQSPEGQQPPQPEMPPLEITNGPRSQERVLPPENVSGKDNAIVRVDGGAAIILSKGDNELKIFDDQGDEVPLPNKNLVMADWEQLGTPESGENWIVIPDDGTVPQGARNFLKMRNIPDELKGTVNTLFENGQAILPTTSWKIDTSDLSKVAVDVHDDHVLIAQPGTDSFIAFATKDADGNTLPPRNWQRIDRQGGDISRVSDALQKHIDQIGISSDIRGIMQTAHGLSVTRTEAGFTVQNSADTTLHTENLPGINNNLCEDPKDPGNIYFTTDTAQTIYKLDTTKSGAVAQLFALPKEYANVRNLKVDSSGNFITFASGANFVVLDKSTMQEVHTVPNIYHPSLDENDTIRGVDSEGHLVTQNPTFEPLIRHIREREVAEAARRAAADLDPAAVEARRIAELEKQFEHLKTQRDSLATQIEQRVAGITDVNAFGDEMTKVDQLLKGMGLSEKEEEYMRLALEGVVAKREQTVVQEAFTQGLGSLQAILSEKFDISSFKEAEELKGELNSLRGRVSDDALKRELDLLDEQLAQKNETFRRQQNEHIRTNSKKIVDAATLAINKIKSKSVLGVWSAEELSGFRSELGSLRAISIPENHAIIDQALLAISRAVTERRTAIEKAEAASGSTETDRRNIMIQAYKEEVRGIIDAMSDQGMQTRDQITSYLTGNDQYNDLRGRLDQLLLQDRDAGQEVRRTLGVSMALYIAKMERAANVIEGGDSRPKVKFGDTEFPIWQEHLKPDVEKQVELTFIKDPQAPPIREGGKTLLMGDVGVIIKNGEETKGRVYQDEINEDDWRAGMIQYRGEFTQGTTVTSEDMKKIKVQYAKWQNGELKREDAEKKKAYKDFYLQRPVVMPDGTTLTLAEAKAQIKSLKERGESVPMITVDLKNEETIDKPYKVAEGEAANAWASEYKRLLGEYGEFASENHILLFNQIDRLRNHQDPEVESSIGYVPEWKSHWTKDKQTERYLEEIAKEAKMQLKLEQGIINLVGHAGTGKDVLVKMFAHETNRRYFAFDASKWTEESDLTEDITLENNTVIKVPTVVLRAIETPGSILYFNEFNAMPEAAQIFLHSLLDEKRSLTLKASNTEVKAAEGVLLMSSMNPNYPGTFKPQFATNSRMDYLPIDYSPLREPDAPTQFSASEALRIARGVDSLEHFTYDLNLDYNEFVKIWGKYINNLPIDAPTLTQEELFDLQTISALVQFTAPLRTAFKDMFTPTRDNRNNLKISQPMTGRELTKCAYDLSEMRNDEKTGPGADPEATAKSFIRRRLLTKVTDEEEKKEVDTALSTWAVAA